jgi:spermidine synthase
MKTPQLISEVVAPDGTDMKLVLRDRDYVVLADGQNLMSSRMHGSEEALATLGCRGLQANARPRVLIGGLGMGYTLRATLDLLPPGGRVVVAELVPAVVEWNRGVLGSLAGHPLGDRRVRVEVEDVGSVLGAGVDRFDAVLLDVDNGPAAFAVSGNRALYDERGLASARAALRRGGVFGVWSARGDRMFERRLRNAGFAVEVRQVRGRLKQGGPRHTIFLAYRDSAPA